MDQEPGRAGCLGGTQGLLGRHNRKLGDRQSAGRVVARKRVMTVERRGPAECMLEAEEVSADWSTTHYGRSPADFGVCDRKRANAQRWRRTLSSEAQAVPESQASCLLVHAQGEALGSAGCGKSARPVR